MSDPVNEDELASLIARAASEEADGKRPHTWGLIRSALLELEQHRSRIAAHEAAHPERLSDDDLAEVVASVDADGDTTHLEDTLDGDDILSLVLECRQRRAADLMPEVLEALQSMRNRRGISQIDVAAIDAVLRAAGVTP